MAEDPKKKTDEPAPPPAEATPPPPAAVNGQVVPVEPQRDGNGIKKFIDRHRRTLDGLSKK